MLSLVTQVVVECEGREGHYLQLSHQCNISLLLLLLLLKVILWLP